MQCLVLSALPFDQPTRQPIHAVVAFEVAGRNHPRQGNANGRFLQT
jgi:hypothetical protein